MRSAKNATHGQAQIDSSPSLHLKRSKKWKPVPLHPVFGATNDQGVPRGDGVPFAQSSPERSRNPTRGESAHHLGQTTIDAPEPHPWQVVLRDRLVWFSGDRILVQGTAPRNSATNHFEPSGSGDSQDRVLLEMLEADERRLEAQAESGQLAKLSGRLRAVVTHPNFDIVVFFLICANALVLVLEDPGNPNPVLKLLDFSFDILYTLEMFLRLGAHGVHRYWWNRWTRLDGTIVIMTWMIYLVDWFIEHTLTNALGVEMSSIRVIRVLKVVKSVKHLRSMKEMIGCLVNAVLRLVDVFTLILFFMFGFALVGNQMFSGVLRQHCVNKSTNQVDSTDFCSTWYGPNKCASGYECRMGLIPTADDIRPRPFKNPEHGFVGFDNILQSLNSILIIMSLEGHEDIMFMLTDASASMQSIPFILIVVTTCSIFAINLILAVIYDSYISMVESKKTIASEESLRVGLSRRLSVSGMMPALEVETDEGFEGQGDEEARPTGLARVRDGTFDLKGGAPASHMYDDDVEIEMSHVYLSRSGQASGSSTMVVENPMTAQTPGGVQIRSFKEVLETNRESRSRPLSSWCSEWRTSAYLSEGWSRTKRRLLPVSKFALYVATSWWFLGLINACIFLNFLVLGCEYEGMSKNYEYSLEFANLCLIAVFTFEFVVNCFGFGLKYYYQDLFNLCDATIVLFSLFEATVLSSTALNLSTIRTLRLVRVLRGLKALHRFRALRQMINAVASTVFVLADFGVLLLLFVFIYALIGKGIFGASFTEEYGFDGNPRRNFDNMGQAMLTVFQVLTGEDWHQVLFNCMRVSWLAGSGFVISLYVIGNHVLLSVVLAILIDNFDFEASSGPQPYDVNTVDGNLNTLTRRYNVQFKRAGQTPLTRAGTALSIGKKARKRATLVQWAEEEGIDVDRIMEADMTSSEAREYYALFQAVDADHSGIISKQEAMDYIEHMYSLGDAINSGEHRMILRLQHMLDHFYVGGQFSHSQRSRQHLDFVNFASLMLKSDRKAQGLDWAPYGGLRIPTQFVQEDALSETLVHRVRYAKMKSLWSSIRPSLPVGPYTRAHRIYTNAFRGAELIDCLMETTFDEVSTYKDAIIVAQSLMKLGFIRMVYSDHARAQAADRAATEEPHSAPRTPGMRSMSNRKLSFAAAAAAAHSSSSNLIGIERNAYIQHRGRHVFEDGSTLYRAVDSHTSVRQLAATNKKTVERRQARAQWKMATVSHSMREGRVLGCVGPRNPLRRFASRVVLHAGFEPTITALVAVSCILSAVQGPNMNPQSTKGWVLFAADGFLNLCFLLECSLKIIASGLYTNPKSYLRSWWNRLDGFVVLLGCFSFGVDVAEMFTASKSGPSQTRDLSVLKVIRAARALRAFRTVKRNAGLKRIVETVLSTIPLAADVSALLIGTILFFSVVGLGLFRGLFNYCDGDGDKDRYSLDRAACHGFVNVSNVPAYTGGLGVQAYTGDSGLFTLVERKWVNQPENFDNVMNAALTLFEVGTLERWPDIFNNAFDVPHNPDEHPVKGYSPSRATLFFIPYLLLGSFVVFHLFVGVIITKFSQSGNSQSLVLSDEQRQWVIIHRFIMAAAPPERVYRRPRFLTQLRGVAFHVATHARFDTVVMLLITANLLIMAMEYEGQPDNWAQFIASANLVFNYIYITELAIRLLGIGFHQYFQSRENQFDSLLVIFCGLDIYLARYLKRFTTVRLLRAARLGRLLKYNKSLYDVTRVFILSLPALLNVGTLLALVYFVFAVVGVNLFHGAERDGQWLDGYSNFDSFNWALLLLWRCSTGASWNGVMHELARHNIAAVPFFVIFIICVTWILFNLFVAVILDHFAHMSPASDTPSLHNLIDSFRTAWTQVNPYDAVMMDAFLVGKFIEHLPAPLGLHSARLSHDVVGRDKLLIILPKPPKSMQLLPHLGRRLKRKQDPNDRLYSDESEYLLCIDIVSGWESLSLEAKGASVHQTIVEFVNSLNLRQNRQGKVFILELLSAVIVRAKKLPGLDMEELLPGQFDDINMALLQETGRIYTPYLQTQDKEQFDDLAFGDLMNAALGVQAVWRARKFRRGKFRMFTQDLLAHTRNLRFAASIIQRNWRIHRQRRIERLGGSSYTSKSVRRIGGGDDLYSLL